ncbi:MAG: hypothetical protein AAF685_11430 [Cyanobacteria bacterium P01_C01_bin.89]
MPRAMFARHRKLVNLSLISLDLPLQSSIRTTAVLYRKDRERCHILFSEPLLAETPSSDAPNGQPNSPDETPQRPQENQNLFGLAPSSQSGSVETLRDRHLWLEISPYRAILTMQGNGGFSYRHLWEQGVYGTSRYWLQTSKNRPHEQLRLRNFTRSYAMEGKGIPQSFRLEYELWTQKLSLGRYVLSLEVQ